MKNKCIIVLGMHRSGTSCLNGTLQEAGVYLGNVSNENPFNKKGNRENYEIMQLHDDLLQDNGGSWDNPPREVVWNDSHKKRRDKIIEEYNAYPLWGFKDPRTLFTLEGWTERLHEVAFVGTFRDPFAVAKSLNRRNEQMSIERGMQLWYLYNSKLLYYYSRFQFPLLSFDLDDSEYKNKLLKVCAFLGLDVISNDFSFFSSDLRNKDEDKRGNYWTPEIKGLYKSLQEASL